MDVNLIEKRAREIDKKTLSLSGDLTNREEKHGNQGGKR